MFVQGFLSQIYYLTFALAGNKYTRKKASFDRRSTGSVLQENLKFNFLVIVIPLYFNSMFQS